MIDLVGLSGTENYAYSINDAGQTVEWSSYASDPNGHAILWDSNVATDLNRYLDIATRNAGWYLTAAIRISYSGRITCDTYNRVTGVRRSYLLSLRRHHH